MKKLIYPFLVFLTSISLSAQRINDSNFADAIRWQCPECIDSAQNLTTKASQITSITLSNKISDLEGISNFSSLVSLNVSDNELKVLPKLPPNLKTLRCTNNKLTVLPNLPASLTILTCDNNRLSSLPTLPKSLKQLNCSLNNLASLPELPRTIEGFYCSYNQITVLPALSASLTDMGCANNNISELPTLPKNLILLSCFNNPSLKCLPTLPDSIKFLEISPTVSCLPNEAKLLKVFLYKDFNFAEVKYPICSNTQNQSCLTTTALADKDSDNSISIFPTYTEGVFFIESNSFSMVKKVEIITVLGYIAAASIGENISQMDISHLPASMYWVKISTTNNKTSIKKLIKI